MTFYTNVSRYGNSILYRGYLDNGASVQHKYKFSPTLYIKNKDLQTPTDWVTMLGE